MITKANQIERGQVDFKDFDDKIEVFKKKWIYTKIFEAENQEHVFDGYLTSLDAHVGNDYLYLNKDGIIPEECLVYTKYNAPAAKTESDEEEEED